MTTRIAAVLLVVALAGLSAGAAEPSRVEGAKPCSSGWTHAVINGEHKCLRADQTCQRAADDQYHRYGFHCHRYDAGVGQYRLTRATDSPDSAPAPAPRPAPAPEPAKPRAQEISARISDVIDGDTLEVRAFGAKRRFYDVRLIGIDTPETVDPERDVECGGPEATSRLFDLGFSAPVDSDGDGLFDGKGGTGRRVTLRTDPTQDLFDRYDRLLAYVTADGTMLQTRMLAAGWATTYVHGSKAFRKVERFRAAERRARDAGRGVHGTCDGDFHREQ